MKNFKRICSISISLSIVMSCLLYGVPQGPQKANADTAGVISEIPGTTKTEEAINGSFLSVTGFAKGKVHERSMFSEGMEEYRTVTTAYEFLQAISDAQKGIVKVIEIKNDLNLGWLELDDKSKEDFGGNLVESYDGSLSSNKTPVANPILIESGISCITLNNINGLTIFSTTGSTLRHAEIKMNSGVNDVVIRNLKFDEVWEWDDWRPSGFGSTGGRGNHKRTGWTFLKINGCKNIWIDHCSFGIAFDGNVDIENGSSGITISWCTFGDTDTSKNSMIYRTTEYLETLYAQSKIDSSVSSFKAYGIMRDNGMTKEQIMQYMGYHSKCHLVGSGDKDSWYIADRDENGNLQYDEATGLIKKKADLSKTNANELLRLSLAYNHYTNMGQRVPMIRGGVGHLYNCYIDDMSFAEIAKLINSDPNNNGKTIKEQIEDAGGTVVLLTRGMDARNEASIAADTCVYYGCSEPIVGSEFQDDERTNLNSLYFNYFGFNHALIVNSSIQKYGEDTTYIGSSWDNNGNNPFVAYKWHDRSTIGNFNWGQEGDSLPYDYKTFPLSDVKENITNYSGSGTLALPASDWLEIEYASDYDFKKTDSSKNVELKSISLNKSSAVIYMDYNEYLQLAEQLTPSNATIDNNNLTWTSLDPTIATVSDSGLVTPKNYGTTTITVTTETGLKASCEVTVAKSVSSVKIKLPDNIHPGDDFYLEAEVLPQDVSDTSVTWGVSGGKLELIDENTGHVRALEAGSSTVYATANLKSNRIGEAPVIARATVKISDTATYPLGDVNLDSKVDITDVTLSLKAALKLLTLTGEAAKTADFNEDGYLTLDDTQMILKKALKIN